MKEEIKKRIEDVRRGEVPKGYDAERAMLYPLEWGKPATLNTVLQENTVRNDDLRYGKDDVLSVSGEQGVVNQIDLLGRSYAGESVAPYHVVDTGDVVYTKSPLKDNPYGIIKQNRGVPGIVSTLYAVYHCNSPITGQYIENYFCIDTFLNNYLKPLVKRGAKNDMKVNNKDVLRGCIPLPPIQEQNRINEIINQFDIVIELKQKLIEEKRRQKKWLMQKLLDPDSGVRLPGFEMSDWDKIRIEKLGEIITGSTPSRTNESYWNGTFPWISAQDFRGKYISETEERITELGMKQCRLLPKGTVLVTCIASIGLNAITTEECATNQQINAIVCSQKYDNEFIFYAVENISKYLQKISGKTAVPIISKNVFSKIEVDVPICKSEQSMIAKTLSGFDSVIEKYEQELAAWQQKKKALMQLLLTGLVRVNA